jgi:hypothetical protein
MNLGVWNQRLAEHFGNLASDRKDVPLFALEHGLAPAELLALQSTLRAHIRVSAPNRDHKLAWTVYAAEIGYGYAGNEFWQTFEKETPGWTLNGNRDWIRDAFVAFQRKFGGAKPSGSWAEHFSIIAWPITHAVLPLDLQQQLARILYELRHSFSAELFEEPTRLGDFIAARSWNTSARFQNLVQAPDLVGQIAFALLLQGRLGFKTLLHPETLKRIGEDVDRERRGRDWLRDARRAAEERAKIRGLNVGRSSSKTPQHNGEARTEIVRLGIEPRLVMRPIEGLSWEVSLEVPDLSHLLLRFPQVRDVLTDSRCTVAGAMGRPLARGRCLHGPQRVALGRWPRPDDVLLKFDRTDAQLEYLLRAECMLRPGTSWLFKIGSDGLAYESRGMRVRAGSKYLLLSTEPFAGSPVARPVDIACQGVQGVLLDVPAALTLEWEQALKQLHVTQAKSIEVWPAGLAAVTWDGEGYGEWIAPEKPTLAIRSDHAMDELTIAMGTGPALSLAMADLPTGEPIFIELPPLPVGIHKFSVAARGGRGTDSELIGNLDVVMRVREARPWSQGSSACGPLELDLDPVAPSLEQLWEGKVVVILRGPAGRQVALRVRMVGSERDAPLLERQLPPVTLPLSPEDWTHHFETHLLNDKNVQSEYDGALACEIELSADELGSFKLRFERAFTPLRWFLRRTSGGFVAQLRDDSDSGVPAVARYSFERPDAEEKLSNLVEHYAPPSGGLYVARVGNHESAIVVPPVVRSLSDLHLEQEVSIGGRAVHAVDRLLETASLWSAARHPGEVIGRTRQRQVSRFIAESISSLIVGSNWSRHEREFSRDEIGVGAFRSAISLERLRHRDCPWPFHIEAVFPREELVRLANTSLAERGAAFVTFATSSLRLEQEMNLLWLAELSLRLASAPGSLKNWAGVRLTVGIERLLQVPSLVCLARFLVLAVDAMSTSPARADEIYSGWRWS